MDANKIKNDSSVQFIKSSVNDTIDIEDARLSFGFWYVSHLSFFKKAILLILFIISIITWGNFLVNFLYYLAFGMKQDDKLLYEMVNVNNIGHDYFSQVKTYDLEISSAEVILNKDKKYDFTSEIKNPNLKYWAEFDYEFVSGSDILYKGRGYVMPQEIKYIISLSNEASMDSAIDFKLSNITWHRIDQKKIRNWEEFQRDHLNIGISGKQFIGSGETSLSDKLYLSRLKFTATNDTPYNYSGLKFNIILKNNGDIKAVNTYTIDEFRSGKAYPVEISWKGDLGFVNEIDITPDINYLNNGSYIKF